MGTSDSNSMPVIIFSSVYFLFILLMLATIRTDSSILPTSFADQNFLTTMISNVVSNTISLGWWNLLVYVPLLSSIIYIGIALATPSWA